MRHWVFRYDDKQQGYTPAGGDYTPREDQALRYVEGHDDLAIYRYDHSALVPVLIPSPKLANGSFLDDLRETRMGRPSQGRSVRLQATITPEQMAWLEKQAMQQGMKQAKTVSDVVFSLISDAMIANSGAII